MPQDYGVPSAALAVSAAGLVLCRAEGISWATVKQLIKSEFKASQRKPLKRKLSKILSASLLSPGCRILITKGLTCLWAIDAWEKLFFSGSLELKFLHNHTASRYKCRSSLPLALQQSGTSTYSKSTALPPEHTICLEKQAVLCKTWILTNMGHRSPQYMCKPNSVHTFVNVSWIGDYICICT